MHHNNGGSAASAAKVSPETESDEEKHYVRKQDDKVKDVEKQNDEEQNVMNSGRRLQSSRWMDGNSNDDSECSGRNSVAKRKFVEGVEDEQVSAPTAEKKKKKMSEEQGSFSGQENGSKEKGELRDGKLKLSDVQQNSEGSKSEDQLESLASPEGEGPTKKHDALSVQKVEWVLVRTSSRLPTGTKEPRRNTAFEQLTGWF
jgi:hypothetical protein